MFQTTNQAVNNISGWWYTYPSEKYESQLGLLFPHIYIYISHQDPIQPSPAESRAPPEIAAAKSADRSGRGTADPRTTQRRDLRCGAGKV